MAGGLSRHPIGELCYRIFPNKGPWIPLTRLPSSRSLKQLKSSSLGNFPRHLEDNPPFVGSMDTNSSVCRRLTLAITQVLKISKEMLHTGTAIGLALNFTVACVFRLPPHTRRLQGPIFLETPGSLLPGHQKEEVPCGSVQKPHLSIHLHGQQRFPNIIGQSVD